MKKENGMGGRRRVEKRERRRVEWRGRISGEEGKDVLPLCKQFFMLWH